MARWLLAGVVIVGMVTWWWPGYRSWGAMTAGLLAVFTLWLAWRMVCGERTVPGHPIHLVLLVPAVILMYHLTRAELAAGSGDRYLLAGGLNLSMIFQLALVGLGVMLTQSLLPQATRHVAVLGICGAGMMAGSAAAMIWGQTQPVRTALALVGFGGVGVWLSMLWGMPSGDAARASLGGWPLRILAVACVAVAACATAGLAWIAPLQALLMVGIAAVAVFLAGLVFPNRRIALLTVGGCAAVAVAVVLSVVDWTRSAILEVLLRAGRASWLGSGEEAFRTVSAADSGLVVLAAMAGWVGAGCFVAGLVVCIAWLQLHARRGQWGDQARAILWTVAAGATACALLAGGGLFTPSVSLAAAFVWGLLPAMLGRRARPRPGAVLLAGVLVIVLLLGLARRAGLLAWASMSLGAREVFLHAVTGFILAMLMAWLLGRKWWLALVGVVLAALAGGVGELLQYAVCRYLGVRRTGELADWLSHAVGSAAAVVPLLLCLGTRWCESADAAAPQPGAEEAHRSP